MDPQLIDRRKVFAIVGALLALGILVGLAFRSPKSAPLPSGPSSPTAGALPASVTVPAPGATDLPEHVVRPLAVQPTMPGSAVDLRDLAEIKIVKNAFEPDTIIVYQNEVVNLKFFAVDRTYDIVQPEYGLAATIPQGGRKVGQFQAVAPGDFIFFCASCGGPAKGPIGHIMVVQKPTR